MNVLILGSGGREHTFAYQVAKSPLCSNLFVAPGNAGTQAIAKNLAIAVNDFEAIKSAVLENNIIEIRRCNNVLWHSFSVYGLVASSNQAPTESEMQATRDNAPDSFSINTEIMCLIRLTLSRAFHYDLYPLQSSGKRFRSCL